MATYLVTGGAGFIGSHLVEALLGAGHRVRVLDNCSTGSRDHLPLRAELVVADITNYDTIRSAFHGVDGVFHVAGLPNVQRSMDQPKETHDVNLTGTLHVLEAARAAGVRRVVFASSAAVYGDQDALPYHEEMVSQPKSPYALQKLASEEYCKTFARMGAIETVCLRFSNVYGPRASEAGAYANVIPVFLRQAAAGQPLTVTGDGEQTRDYIHVTDVVRAMTAAMTRATVGHGEMINVSSNIERSVHAVARLIGGAVQPIASRVEPRRMRLDNRRARELLGWEPRIPFHEGITALLDTHGIRSPAPSTAPTLVLQTA
ncbi:NAD-dependent epimerase/dehydratase family protein [Candidatus Uhrbacteria bacterium]|nr:NAD-dependent epimerase/dehydratase family protein [Candidatus Uhrbacteria bacterium]